MKQQTTFSIVGPAGNIETISYTPVTPPCGIAIIAHPHPLHGGTMHNKVITTLARLCRDLGFIAYTFNFRGVGLSEGQYGHAIGEQDDLNAVIAFAKHHHPDRPIWLAGFSFGAYVSTQVAQKHPPDCLISICPPVYTLDVPALTERSYQLDYAHIQPPACPWIIVQTDDDEIVDAPQVKAWAHTLNPQPTLIEIATGGHFFHGQLLTLRDKLGAALTAKFPNLCLTP